MVRRLELASLDLTFRLRGSIPYNSNIVLVEITDSDIAKIGRWPWKRAWHAAMAKSLKELGAKTTYFDIVFSEASSEEDDIVFEEAIKLSKNVYLPFAFQSFPYEIDNALFPLKRFSSNARGLGAANIGSALSFAFPVTGSISRSAVNFSAGANTPLACIVSALLLALALVGPTGWLALMPLPALAATIIVAVLGMLELSTLRTAWRYDRRDAVALVATTGGVLVLGIEAGVIVGVMISMANLIWRASHPHIAVLGRIAGSEHFRNVERYQGQTIPHVLMLRIDANLFFGNVEAVNARIEDELKAHPAARHLVLVMTAVSEIDTSALFALMELNQALKLRGIGLHLAEVKGPVMDRLKQSTLFDTLNGGIFLSALKASEHLSQASGG